MGNKVWRLTAHLIECLVKTKDGHSGILDWLPLLGCLLVALSPILTRYFLPEEIAFHQFKEWMAVNSWYIGICGIAAIFVVAFWHSFDKWDELNEKLKPRLLLSNCTPQDNRQGGNRVFHLGVSNISDVDVEECEVRLVKIKHNENEWETNDILTFQRSEDPDSQSKTLRPGVPYKVDIIFLEWDTGRRILPGTKVNGIAHSWNHNVSFQNIISAPGEYLLFLIISGKNPCPTTYCQLKFTYEDKASSLQIIPLASICDK